MGKTKRALCVLIVAMLAVLPLSGCNKKVIIAANPNQKSIAQIDRMKALPDSYKYKDYKATAQALDRAVYDFAKSPVNKGYNATTFGPVGYWDDTNINISSRTFGFPSYIGANNAGTVGAQEGITVMGTLWGSSLAGIDKSKQVFTGADGTEYEYNFIKMAEAFFNTDADVRFVMNNKKQKTGHTFWYELYPQIQFIHLADLYPAEGVWMNPIILEGAQRWHDVLPNFKLDGETNFEFLSYDFGADMPIYGERWNEPPNGGLAMIFYSAYKISGDERFLEDCKYVLDYLQGYEKNPYYEILSDYAAPIAAILNAEHGCNYDVQKFLNYSFAGGSDFRGGSQVVVGSWGGYTADGLMGFGYSDSTSDGYAFAMNTFHLASTFAPTVKYDPRYADAAGKWFQNVVNSSRLFYGDELPAANQSRPQGIAVVDPSRSIAYEGVRSSYNYKGQGAKAPFAMGDPTIHGWGETDLGIYGGGHVGILGGLVSQTDVDKILQIDLNKTDVYDDNYKAFMYFNPYDTEKTVSVDFGGAYKVYDTVSNTVLCEDSSAGAKITIAPNKSFVAALLPLGATLTQKEGRIFCGDVYVSNVLPTVNIVSPKTEKQVLQNGDKITFDYSTRGEPVEKIVVKVGGKVHYEGAPVKEHTLKFSFSERGLQLVTVEAITKDGLRDIASTKIRIL